MYQNYTSRGFAPWHLLPQGKQGKTAPITYLAECVSPHLPPTFTLPLSSVGSVSFRINLTFSVFTCHVFRSHQHVNTPGISLLSPRPLQSLFRSIGVQCSTRETSTTFHLFCDFTLPRLAPALATDPSKRGMLLRVFYTFVASGVFARVQVRRTS